MATHRETTAFECRKCKTKGTITVSETDHPYSMESYLDSITDGFRAENVQYPSADVFCKKCGKKVLG